MDFLVQSPNETTFFVNDPIEATTIDMPFEELRRTFQI